MLVVLTSVGLWRRRARATELQYCAAHPEVTLSPSWPLQSPLHPNTWTPMLPLAWEPALRTSINLLMSCSCSTCRIIQPSVTAYASQRIICGTTLSCALQLCTTVVLQLDATSSSQEGGGPQQPPIQQVVIVNHPDGCQSVTILRQQLKPSQPQMGC